MCVTTYLSCKLLYNLPVIVIYGILERIPTPPVAVQSILANADPSAL